MHMNILPACMNVHHMHGMPLEAKKTNGSHKLELEMAVNQLIRVLEMSPGPLKEQMFLTIEPLSSVPSPNIKYTQCKSGAGRLFL